MQRSHITPLIVRFSVNDDVDKMLSDAFEVMVVKDVTSAINALRCIESALKECKESNKYASLDGKVVASINRDTITYHFRNMTTLRQAFTFFKYDLSKPAVAIPKIKLK